MATEYTGSALYLQWIYNGNAGTVTLNSDYRTFVTQEPIDKVDSSAGADTHRSVLTTLTNGTMDLEILPQTDGTALFAALKPGYDGTLTIGPEGTATGKEKRTVFAVILSRERDMKYDDVTTLKVQWQMQAAPTESVF